MSGHKYDDYVFDVRIKINAMSQREAEDLLIAALKEKIDGWLLAPQRAARLLSIRPADDPAPSERQSAIEYLRALEQSAGGRWPTEI